MAPIDSSKVEAYLKQLNKESPADSPEWKEINGVFAITSLEINNDSSLQFNPASGYPLKAFLNLTNGEVKLVTAYLFTQTK